jgi:hypothetical protein
MMHPGKQDAMQIPSQSFDDILADEFFKNDLKPWNPAERCSGSLTTETEWIHHLADEQEFIESYFELDRLISRLRYAFFLSEEINSN